MDQIDKRILHILQADAKMTTKEVATQLNLTTTPVYERIKRLEREGFINGYKAVLDRKKLDLGLMVFCNVSLEAHSVDLIQKFEDEVQQLDEVVACYHIAGLFDYLLQVLIKDMDLYQEFVTQKLAGLSNIRKVQSFFVMTEVKKDGEIPIIF